MRQYTVTSLFYIKYDKRENSFELHIQPPTSSILFVCAQILSLVVKHAFRMQAVLLAHSGQLLKDCFGLMQRVRDHLQPANDTVCSSAGVVKGPLGSANTFVTTSPEQMIEDP